MICMFKAIHYCFQRATLLLADIFENVRNVSNETFFSTLITMMSSFKKKTKVKLDHSTDIVTLLMVE